MVVASPYREVVQTTPTHTPPSRCHASAHLRLPLLSGVKSTPSKATSATTLSRMVSLRPSGRRSTSWRYVVDEDIASCQAGRQAVKREERRRNHCKDGGWRLLVLLPTSTTRPGTGVAVAAALSSDALRLRSRVGCASPAGAVAGAGRKPAVGRDRESGRISRGRTGRYYLYRAGAVADGKRTRENVLEIVVV